MFEFEIVSGRDAKQILDSSAKQVVDLVEDAYLRHDAGRTLNPDSYFLRFPEKPDSRIIALPAFIELSDVSIAGIKWISSYPSNVTRGIPRASAVLVLNDYATGYPIALLEAAAISAARTAASAAVAARALARYVPATGDVAIVGAGVIARNIVRYLTLTDYPIRTLIVFDVDLESADNLARYASTELGLSASVAPSLAAAAATQTLITATTAASPYLDTPLEPGQLVLNISLRDFDPAVVLAADNYFDDVEHCLKAGTSPHLAEQVSDGRTFVTGTLADVLRGRNQPTGDRPVIFSPFGLGILDLAVGHFVLRTAREQGIALVVDDFFGETRRW